MIYSSTAFLQSIIAFCKDHPAELMVEIVGQKPTIQELHDTIKAHSSMILERIITKEFWESNSLKKPMSPISTLNPTTPDFGTIILLFVTWSWFDETCHREVLKMLNHVEIQCKMTPSFKALLLIKGFVNCVRKHITYTAESFRKQFELTKELSTKGSTVVFEAMSLKNAITESSTFFQTLTDSCLSEQLISSYFKKMKRDQLLIKFKSDKFEDVYDLMADFPGEQKFSLHSWFMKEVLIPRVNKYLCLDMLHPIIKQLKTLQENHNLINMSQKDLYLKKLEDLSKEVLSQLGIDLKDEKDYASSRIIVVTALMMELVNFDQDLSTLSEKDLLITKLLLPFFFLSVASHSLNENFKVLIEQKSPPLIPIGLIVEYVQSNFVVDEKSFINKLEGFPMEEVKNSTMKILHGWIKQGKCSSKSNEILSQDMKPRTPDSAKTKKISNLSNNDHAGVVTRSRSKVSTIVGKKNRCIKNKTSGPNKNPVSLPTKVSKEEKVQVGSPQREAKKPRLNDSSPMCNYPGCNVNGTNFELNMCGLCKKKNYHGHCRRVFLHKTFGTPSKVDLNSHKRCYKCSQQTNSSFQMKINQK